MRNGNYIETFCRNLREFNDMRKNNGYSGKYIFTGYNFTANGHRERSYVYVNRHGQKVGREITIYFNVD